MNAAADAAATTLALDHLVIGAATLDAGVAWCKAMLGITPGPGGPHALMGTQNRVFRVATAAFPDAYIEIIAIDPEAAPPRRVRWFDLDAPALQACLQQSPRLIAWAARCVDIAAAKAALREQGIDAGAIVRAERATADGTLRWQIAVRADGRRLHDGALPTLIEWGAVHPAHAMPASGATLESVTVGGLPDAVAALLPAALGVDRCNDAAAIRAVLATPLGRVELISPRLEG